VSTIPGGDVRVSPELFKDVVKNHHAPAAKNVNLTRNPAEWILRFHKQEFLDDSYFHIFSGYGNDHIFTQRSLTIGNNEPQAFLRETSATNEPQKWHFEPARKERGFTEVRIYVKGHNDERKYLSLPSDVIGEREYHYSKPADVAEDKFERDGDRDIATVGTNTDYDLKKWQLHEKSGQPDDAAVESQVFRIWECDYGLANHAGTTARGLQRDVYKKTNLIDLLTDKSEYMKKIGRLEDFLTEMFGISYARVQKTLFEETLADLIASIDKEMNKASSIHDYAGAMRIHTNEFNIMMIAWPNYIQETKDTKGGNKGCEDDQLCLFLDDRVKDGFMQSD
jgi:hypothetical protein